MRKSRRQLCTLLVTGSLWCSAALDAAAAPADDAARAKARTLGYAGVESYAEGDFDTASAKLEESFQLLPVPSLGLWSARALVRLGKLVQAEQRYRSVASLPLRDDDPPAQQTAKADAAREHLELLPKIPSLKIQLSGADAEDVVVIVDGGVRQPSELAVALLMNPGRHEVVGTRGAERSGVVLNLGEGAHEEVELRFADPRPEPDAPVDPLAPAAPRPVNNARRALRTGAWIAVGAGAAGLATSLVTFLMAKDLHDSFEERDNCAMNSCSQEEVDTYNTLRSVHLVGLIAGSVLTGAGASVLVLTWKEAPWQPRDLALRIGPTGASLVGRF
jgi:hypothetical protein